MCFYAYMQIPYSILKGGSLNNNYKLNAHDIIPVTGAVDKPIYTLSSIFIGIYLGLFTITQKIQKMLNSFCIPCDGIIGNDIDSKQLQ